MKKELIDTFKSRKNQYAKVIFRGVCLRGKEGGKLYPVNLIFECSKEKKEPGDDEKLIYGPLVLIKTSIELDKFEDFLTTLEEKGSLNCLSEGIEIPIGLFRNVEVESSQEFNQKAGGHSPLSERERKLLKETRSYPQSAMHFWPLKIIWPTKFFIFKIGSTAEYNTLLNKLKNQPYLMGPNNPIFPSYQAIFAYWLGKENEFWSDWNFLFIMPDYRARIKKVKISKNNLELALEQGLLQTDKLTGKFYVGYDLTSPQTGDTTFSADGTAQISTRGFPSEFYFALSEKTGVVDVIDYRHYGWGYRKKEDTLDIEFHLEEENLDFLINKGEGLELEFKVDIQDPKEFLETISAFSNSYGGKILVGVDNYGNIKGLEQGEKYLQKINDFIEQWIKPRPAFSSTCVSHGEKQVIIVTVYDGYDKPYLYEKHGVYIRAGSTDRIASRSELDNFYIQKKK